MVPDIVLLLTPLKVLQGAKTKSWPGMQSHCLSMWSLLTNEPHLQGLPLLVNIPSQEVGSSPNYCARAGFQCHGAPRREGGTSAAKISSACSAYAIFYPDTQRPHLWSVDPW